MSKTVPFQTIQFSISTQFKCKNSLSKTLIFQAIQFSQTVLIQAIQFFISMQFSSSTTIPVQSRPGSNGHEGVLCIPRSSRITRNSPSDCLVSYLGHSLQLVYTTAPADWATYEVHRISFQTFFVSALILKKL